VQDAIADVRGISATRRQRSQTAIVRAEDVQKYATHLAPVQPTPQESRDAESRILDMFTEDMHPDTLSNLVQTT